MRTFLLLSLYVWEIKVALSQSSANGDDCLPRIPDDFGCTKPYNSFTDPDDCNKYTTCVPEKNCGPTYMGYKYTSCPQDQFYDDTLGECVRTFKCPSNPDIKQTAENACKKIGPAFADENNCRKYITCAADEDTWYFKDKECPASGHFNKETMKCEKGECEGCLEEAPLYADCETNGVGSKFRHEDCTKFYTCETNVQGCGSSGWGSFEHNCPIGKYFDIASKECVASQGCPRRCPPKLDNQKLCTRDGEVLSGDCRQVTVCNRVETCDHNSFESYWTTDVVTCSPGEFYNARQRKCVKTTVCPQVFEDENCPGVVWEYMGKDGYNFEDRFPNLDHFICRGMVNSKTLGVGVFYKKNQKCYLAPPNDYKEGHFYADWVECKEYELLSSASTGLFIKRRESFNSEAEQPFLLQPTVFAVICKLYYKVAWAKQRHFIGMKGTFIRSVVGRSWTANTFIPDYHQLSPGVLNHKNPWDICYSTALHDTKEDFEYYLACKPDKQT